MTLGVILTAKEAEALREYIARAKKVAISGGTFLRRFQRNHPRGTLAASKKFETCLAEMNDMKLTLDASLALAKLAPKED